MTLITSYKELNTKDIATKIKHWLDKKDFETKVFQIDNDYVIKAKKSSVLRAVFGADRALEIGVRNHDKQTQVNIRQGSWKTNAVSNAAWLFVTGGANLLISGWSIVIQKELESYIRTILEVESGAKEIILDYGTAKEINL